LTSMGADVEQVERKKSVLRTIRLSENLSKELEQVAAEDGISFNAISVSVLQEYVGWTRRAKKFGFGIVSKNLLKILLESSDGATIDRLVRERYAGVLKDMAMFWYSDASLPSIMKVLELLSLHNWHIDLSKRIEGRRVSLSFRHDLGPKFTIFLRAMLETTVKGEFHLMPTFESGDSSLTVHFSLL